MTAQRTSVLSEVTTSGEQGYPSLAAVSTLGLVGPPGLPDAIRTRLYAAMAKATQAQNIRDYLGRAGNAIDLLGGPEYERELETDFERWGKVIRESNITLD